MKDVIKIFASLSLVLFMAVSMNAQNATTVADNSDAKKSEVKKCNPELCDAMVKAGLCTKEEAEKCKAKCAAGEQVTCSPKGTKVASASAEKASCVKTVKASIGSASTTKVAAASVEKTEEGEVSTTETAKKASCAKKCAKTCASKKKAKAD